MSFILRSSSKAFLSSTSQIIKRHAHKKANLQVKLNQYVEGLGIEGEVVSVRPGLMRNILYPAGKASYVNKSQLEEANNSTSAEEAAVLNTERLQQSVEASEQKKKELLGHLEAVHELQFNRAVVPNSTHTFGSVTAEDLVSKIKEEFGFDVDKSTIEFKSEGGRIKSLGKHQVFVQIGQKTAEISVVVNPAA